MNKKKSINLFIFTLLITVLFLYSCGGGGDDDNNGNDNPQQPPASAPFAQFGSIRGSVESAGGQPLNAVHVRAVNLSNNNIQISVFSGITTSKSILDGFFQIDRLPPGNYRVLIENLDGRSSIFNPSIYSDFVQDQNPLEAFPNEIAFPDEYFNGDSESSSDNVNDFSVINVEAGEITTGIDFITNN